MSNEIVIPLAILCVFNMSLPVIWRILHGESPAKLQILKAVPDASRVMVIFEGTGAPSPKIYWKFIKPYVGDVVYVQYAHDGCAMDKYCQQVLRLVMKYHYRRVDVLGVSIGALVFPTLTEMFGRHVDLRLYGICPVGPDYTFDHTRFGMKALSVALLFLKIMLGAIGELVLIRWNGELHSPSELIEQLFIAAWGRPLWQEWYPMRGYPVWRQLRNVKSLLRQGYYTRLDYTVIGFALAEDDEFVDSAKVEDLFGSTWIRYCHGEHARLHWEYYHALKSMGLYE